MASEDSSFNASGPTVVAFETITGPGDRSFGVSVSGKICGVYGQGTEAADSQDDRTSPRFTGVLGVGDFHGVYGGAGALDIATEAPAFDFGGGGGGIGVIGVNRTKNPDSDPQKVSGFSPAILGLNDVLQVDLDPGKEAGSAVTDLAVNPVAVGALSRRGHGVCGISLNMTSFDRTVDLSLPDPKGQPGVGNTLQGLVGTDPVTGNPETTDPAGVIGIAMTGPGLRGVSLTGRGAIFQSATNASANGKELNLFEVLPPPVAQIRLVPHANMQFSAVGGQEPPLPREGKMGDLLALAVTDSNRRVRADLWFCVGKDSDTGNAVWQKLAFSVQVIGTV